MANNPRILSLAAAQPPFHYQQDEILAYARDRILGLGWADRPEDAQRARQMEHLFAASRVHQRHSSIDLATYYEHPRSTGERMMEYQTVAHRLSLAAMRECLRDLTPQQSTSVTDLIVVSCTGYGAPGIDIQVAHDIGLSRDVRRTSVGHMGCFGALVGLRQSVAAVRAYPGAVAALLSVEVSSLHFAPTLDPAVLTSFALFGDAAAALVVGMDDGAVGPEIVDTYCVADYSGIDQMSWQITDQGFIMGLSPRVPVTLRRNVSGAVTQLLDGHGLTIRDVTHWLVHPGGPSILEAVQEKLELSDAQMAPSWEVLRDHGNCSSATILLILQAVLRAGTARPGEWGVMMAFGPGLTLETCLLRF